MQRYIERYQAEYILSRLSKNPAVAILGPRQCGKSTLVKRLSSKIRDPLYLDLESPRDLRKLTDPEAFLEHNRGKTIIIDEVQRKPDLFAVARSLIDKSNRNRQFLFLGSASPELIRQSSESLAGRIAYIELSPFLVREVGVKRTADLWLKGGFPRSYLEKEPRDSVEWRYDFIRTFLERDIPALGFKIPVNNIERLWRMTAHATAQVANYSAFAASLGVSGHTVKNYLDLLAQTFMIRLLPPYLFNIKKRLVKSPKLYLRDTGIVHALLGIETRNDLMGHPVFGASWETFAVENVLASIRNWQAFFYRTGSGNEIDLFLLKGRRKIAVECKASTSPSVTRGFYVALDDLEPQETWILSPVEDDYVFDRKRNIFVGNPYHLVRRIDG
jgi:hypothetical protein